MQTTVISSQANEVAQARAFEGSETSSRAKAVMLPRVPSPFTKGEDIVRHSGEIRRPGVNCLVPESPMIPVTCAILVASEYGARAVRSRSTPIKTARARLGMFSRRILGNCIRSTWRRTLQIWVQIKNNCAFTTQTQWRFVSQRTAIWPLTSLVQTGVCRWMPQPSN